MNTTPDRAVPFATEHNDVGFWLKTWGDKPNLTCKKFDRGADYITIDGGHERLVIKNDQRTLIWFNPGAGNYGSDKGVSHYILCDWFDDPPADPSISIKQTCVDKGRGVRDVLRLTAYANSDGETYPLFMKLNVGGKVREVGPRDFIGEKTVMNGKRIGAKKTYYRGVVRLGELEKVITGKVRCEGHISARIIGPFLDPYHGAVVKNKTWSTHQVIYRWHNGEEVKRVTKNVGAGCTWRLYRYSKPQTMIRVWDKTDKEVLATATSAKGGNYGPLPTWKMGVTCP